MTARWEEAEQPVRPRPALASGSRAREAAQRPNSSGLVQYAIPEHDGELPQLAEETRKLFAEAWRHRFPTAEMVSTAAAMFCPVERRDTGRFHGTPEGPTWQITIAPGLVQVGTHDHARGERSHYRQGEHHRHRIDEHAALVGQWADIDPVPEELDEAQEEQVKRGRITQWSRKSRANMYKTLCMLDYGPMIARAEQGRMPAIVTLTSPGDWVAVFPTVEEWRLAMKRFKLRYQRSWNEPPVGPWKDEFQRRGAPHRHIWMNPPHGTADQRYAGKGLSFPQWLSRTWADCAGAKGEEREKHIRAGTGIDYAQGLRATDPRKAAAYFLGHNTAGGGKEYQHRVPQEWEDTGGPGRFWGVWGLKKAAVTVEVSPEDGVQAARLLRRHAHAQGVRVQVSRPRGGGVRVQSAYPEVMGVAGAQLLAGCSPGGRRRRRTGVRLERMTLGRGWVAADDGPGLAGDVARYLDMRREWMEDDGG